MEFDGELLAFVSSKENDDQEFWQEIKIYRTTTGKFVTEMVRETSSLPGRVPDELVEPRILTVKVYDDPANVRKGLFLRNNDTDTRFLTNHAREALTIAAEAVPEIGTIDPDVQTERI